MNCQDPSAVAIMNSAVMIGHISKKISCASCFFDGVVQSSVK